MFERYIAYVKDNPKGLWFKQKMFGWGWTPVKWQGWLVIVVYVALLIAATKTIDQSAPKDAVPYTFLAIVILLTAALFFVTYKKGEKPSWHWGWPKE
jgi:hypothetical protein